MRIEIERLKESPLFAMSLGSKELFHSNFWGWLFEQDTRYAQIFFPEITHINEIKREQANRDLTLWVDGKAYVIENKIKAFPSLKQLSDYQAALEEKNLFIKGVITGIIEPSFMSECKRWGFLSYENIGNAMLNIVGNNLGFISDLIREYATMIINISTAVVNFTNAVGQRLVNADECSEMDYIRLGDICKKINAEMFVQELTNSIGPELELLKPEGYILEITSGFTNKTSLVDIRYTSTQNHSDMIGLQIQGFQYRRCAEKRTDTDCKSVFDDYKSAGWFTDYDPKRKPKQIFGHTTSLGNVFDQYIGRSDNTTYYFVYQYWNIEDFSFDSLKRHILHDMKTAAQIASEIQN